MLMRRNRPIWPGHATVHEAVQYLASVCDGAIKHDGHGFRSDHVAYGHWLAQLPLVEWGPQECQHGLSIVRTYSAQLRRAGFDPEQILRGGRPPRIGSKRSAQLQPGWATDPAGIADSRWWNGVRWTAACFARPNIQ